MSHDCPDCECESAWGRFMRYLGTEMAIYTTPKRAPGCRLIFQGFRGSDSMQAAYQIQIPKVEDPNNRGYILLFSVDGQSKPDLPVTDGQEIILPANGNLFMGILVPVGPNGPRSDKASPEFRFNTEVYVDTPPPPPPPPPDDVQPAPKPEFVFAGFRDDNGNPVA